jgi:hypothetical protein
VANKRNPPAYPFPWPQTGDCYSRCDAVAVAVARACGECVASCRGWEANFFTDAMGSAYQDLYNNHNGMMDDMVNFWQKSAAYFANQSSVIGYEV